jgi:predicted TIM-barrel fold metal-dependent hydrolase
MLADDIQIISVDDHVIEGPRVWLDRLPSKYQDVAPRIETDETGNQHWVYEGAPAGNFALNAVAGKDPRDFKLDPRSYDDMLPGCYDIKDRIRDMDLEGVHAQVCFSNMAGFAGRVFWQSKDKELGAECVRAYNDFMIDEWCAYDPGRQIPMVILPFWDIHQAIAEVKRTASKGAKAVSFIEAPHRLGLPSYHTNHWDPLMSVIEEIGTPVLTHFGSGGGCDYAPPEADPETGNLHAIMIAMMGMNSMAACIDLMFSHIFHKFPGLKFVLAEGGIGWLPYALERSDYTWERHRFYNDINQEMKPSEVFARNMYGCFIADNHGIASRDTIGVDKLLFESDYPHSDSRWPHTRKILKEEMQGVPDEDVRKIMEDNARKLFNFPRL